LSPSPTATLVGSPASPFVRKVMAVSALKGVGYRLDPIVGFMGSDAFSEISPLRRIPVWIDDQVTLSDSSVILQYLEDRYPSPSVFPVDIADRAKARWLEEYADTRLADVFLWKLFFQRVVGPFVLGRETDEAVVARALETDAPDVCAYLEAQTPEKGFLFGDLSVADIAVAAFFFNARVAGFKPDRDRWPKLVAWLGRMDADSPLGALNKASFALLKVPPAEHRAALTGMGFTPSDQTWAGDRPRRGPLSVF